ncbi:hypothetical protein [Curtobacterium sp. MCSS17_016]|uniref:hypothetical protein n=1 Tax=Curtobacterium sp. MCSS17_016 TaxID=2175644 RepID=UPI000DA8D2D7|nr:hypothetical protein [Curtobacterium sp. MCSS17_016]WIE81258.1 hypothetical protein DEJ19_018670 [Curtobacterium sp. MCSS17_016]
MFTDRIAIDVNDLLYPLRTATEKTTQVLDRLGDFPQDDPEIGDITAEVKAAAATLQRAIDSVNAKQHQENIVHAKQSTLRRLAQQSKPLVSFVLYNGDEQRTAIDELVLTGLITKTDIPGDDKKFNFAITDAGRELAAEFEVVHRAAHEAQKAYRRVDA